jgi:hypothetical protein
MIFIVSVKYMVVSYIIRKYACKFSFTSHLPYLHMLRHSQVILKIIIHQFIIHTVYSVHLFSILKISLVTGNSSFV